MISELRADTKTTTLTARFDAAALLYPTRVAVTAPDASLTYHELARRSDRIAHALLHRGVGAGTLVGLCIDRSADLIAGMLGILKAGAAYVPIDPEYPPARIAFLFEDAAPAAVVTVSRLLSRVPKAAVTLCVDDASHLGGSADSILADADPGQLAYVIYTSGSSGLPKGVAIEHRNVVELIDAGDQLFGFSQNDVWTLFHSFAFDFSVWEMFGALLHGGRCVIVPHEVTRSPASFYALLAREHVTVLNQTPSAFRGLLAEDARARLDLSLRLVIFGGEALDVRMLAPWFERHGDEQPALVNMYGITETTVHVTHRRLRVDDAARSASPIGTAIPGWSLRVDESGELLVGGAGVARGYLRRPELNAERFVEIEGYRYYKSGDRVALAESGELSYIGRIDEQLKVRGFRIEPREIETILASDDAVAGAVVVAKDFGEGDVRLVAYVSPASRATDAQCVERLRERVAVSLPEHMQPSVYIIVPTLPMTAHGKADRAVLAALPVASTQRDRAADASAIEALRAIWKEVLALDEVGLDDDFFDLGGTSLSVVRMLARLNARFDVRLDPSTLMEDATIRSLARSVESAMQRSANEVNPC